MLTPYGAHPTACRLFYDYDPAFLNNYKRRARDDDAWHGFLDEWVYGLAGHDEYIAKVGEERPRPHKGRPGARLRPRPGPAVRGGGGGGGDGHDATGGPAAAER